mmetsp:Transcript_34136/g.79331  ORF Transcript_34136/g.79331 Transcript_34136/m.79331 type:complete len:83 (+) Transcript_34136:211-459(+)
MHAMTVVATRNAGVSAFISRCAKSTIEPFDTGASTQEEHAASSQRPVVANAGQSGDTKRVRPPREVSPGSERYKTAERYDVL